MLAGVDDLLTLALLCLSLPVAGLIIWWVLRRQDGQTERRAWEPRQSDPALHARPVLPPAPREPTWLERNALPPGSPSAVPPPSPLPVLDAALTAPRTSTTLATRDLATAQVALLERCPGCGRPATGANSRADDQGRRWHLDCRAT
jgi:hypothetical protein